MFNKKKKLIKDKAIIELENVAQKILDKANWCFDVMQERDNLKVQLADAVAENKEKSVAIKGYEKIIAEKDKAILAIGEKYNELFNLFEKITDYISITNEELTKEIEELKSNRYKVLKVKSCTGTKQKIGIKSNTVESKIIKKIKER